MSVYQLHDCDKVCLLPRLSLSELIHISGLVRAISERSTDVMLVAKRDHVRPIRNVYYGMENVRFTFVESWAQIGGVLDRMEADGYRIVPLPSFREACPYTMLGLEISLAESGLAVQRHADSERALLERVRAAVGPTYIVVHDDEERRVLEYLMPEGIPRVHVRDPVWRTPNPCDWIRVIDHAVQFHGIESCFLLLADSLSLRARKFCHAYCNPAMSGRPCGYKDVIVIWG